MRVALVQSVLTHYRLGFHGALAARNPRWSLELIHSGEKGAGIAREPLAFEESITRMWRLPFPGFNLSFQTGALRRLCGDEFDVVVLEGSFGILSNLLILLVRRMNRRPTLFWAAGWERPDLFGWRKRLRSWVVRMVAGWSEGAIVYGGAARRYMLDHGVPAERIHVAQNTIDVESLQADLEIWRQRGRRVKADLRLEGPLVLYVGRVVATKRLDDLIDAMPRIRERVPGSYLVVVGDGPDLDEARRRAGEGIHFAGPVVDGVEAYFAAADLFVMPGTGGLALNQAMALEIPVVATVSDGTHEDLVVPGVNGHIVPVGSPEALADAISGILANPLRRREMAVQSGKIVRERASLSAMVSAFSRAVEAAGGRRESGVSKTAPGVPGP